MGSRQTTPQAAVSSGLGPFRPLWLGFWLALAGAVALSMPAYGAATAAPQTPTRAQTIAAVNTYLNSIKTFSAQFEQKSPGRPSGDGSFYLSRPGKFLWLYDHPDPLKLVSDGGLAYFIDETTGQVTQIPREGFAALLTSPHIDLNKKPFTVGAIDRRNGLVSFTVSLGKKKGEDAPQEITLGFMTEPLQLRQIISHDQLGNAVEVLFYNIRENRPIPDRLFAYTPPQYREK